MNTPKLKRTKISISYGMTNGSGLKYDAKGGAGTKHPITGEEVPPHIVLIDAIGQLSRASVMFGFEDAALEVFTTQRDEALEQRKAYEIEVTK